MPSKECYWKNPEYYRQKSREYCANNKSESSKVWAKNNLDKVKAIKRRYYLKNKEQVIQRNIDRRDKLKRECIQHLGGSCKKCRLETDCLDVYCFHHRSPVEKSFSISSKRTSTLDKIKYELDKCDLLCSNCHRKEHIKIRDTKDSRYRRNKKAKAVNMFGGKCVDCGIKDDPCIYDFHHPNSSEKDFGFGDNRSWATTEKELSKCVMVCANCHKQRHSGSPLRGFNESSLG